MDSAVIDKPLDDYIRSVSKKDFEWGKLDCVMFACDWIFLKTGKNPAEKSRGKYHDEESAYQHLRDTYGSIEEEMDTLYESVDPAFRQKGDIALCEYENINVLGVVGGSGFVFFKSLKTGVAATKTAKIKKVWRV